MDKIIAVIPTYNEKENIVAIINAVKDVVENIDVLVVDDSSPDGTAELVKKTFQGDHKVHLLQRQQKMGLGPAYFDGFQYCLDRGYDIIIQMDADFSHSPSRLVDMIKELQNGAGLVIGSRYVANGGTENWGILRKLTSRLGSLYASVILALPVKDVTGGFKAWRDSVLSRAIVSPLLMKDFGFQIEMNYRAFKSGARIKEIPIIFKNREKGNSKMQMKIATRALVGVWKIRFSTVTH